MWWHALEQEDPITLEPLAGERDRAPVSLAG
jgi:hypothetical protein